MSFRKSGKMAATHSPQYVAAKGLNSVTLEIDYVNRIDWTEG